jgi:hypothetical protein
LGHAADMAAMRSAHKILLIRPEWNSHLENVVVVGRTIFIRIL